MVTTWTFQKWLFRRDAVVTPRRIPRVGEERGSLVVLRRRGRARAGYSIALTMSSTTFLASPKTIIVLSM